MTLKELLKVKDDAEKAHSEAIKARDDAAESLAILEDDLGKAVRAKIDANHAIHVRLREKGMHTIVDADNTVTAYRAVEPSEANPNGWIPEHPIPGEDA